MLLRSRGLVLAGCEPADAAMDGGRIGAPSWLRPRLTAPAGHPHRPRPLHPPPPRHHRTNNPRSRNHRRRSARATIASRRRDCRGEPVPSRFSSSSTRRVGKAPSKRTRVRIHSRRCGGKRPRLRSEWNAHSFVGETSVAGARLWGTSVSWCLAGLGAVRMRGGGCEARAEPGWRADAAAIHGCIGRLASCEHEPARTQ
jgi:hypothetical protein